MADTEFIELQKSRLIQNIERCFSMPVPPELEDEISRILHQIASNEAATKTSKRHDKSK
jgi:hypothetical protein